MRTTEFIDGLSGLDTVTTPPPPEIGALPFALLMAALDDPHTGRVIFDAQRRVLHLTSYLPSLLELRPEEPTGNLDVLELLSRSAFTPETIKEAKELVLAFDGEREAAPAFLQTSNFSRRVCMRLRRIGQQYRVASFELVSQETPPPERSEIVLSDSLTGLASKYCFEKAVAEALAAKEAKPVAILLMDLDRFKAVNETLGHAAGDSLLCLAAERLKSAVRKGDLIARLSADEFAVLIQPCPTKEEPATVAGRILDLVQRTYFIQGQLINVGTSIGIACSPNDGECGADLIRNADLALHHSKKSGAAKVTFFDTSMERRAQARRTSELELRRALALRQLQLYYQPQVDTSTNRLVGFEALIRWKHPERGMIPPADFLPVAEEIGLIVPIGDWVLRTACREAMNWPDHITIAVNASPLQFDAGNFSESVQRALKGTGLPGERLEIEITEGILLRNDDAILRTLHDLRSMKVRIAMDDFGTGYASLSQLAKFPFDKIKIDRSLAGFEGDNQKRRAIVRAITALGESLGVRTLAEGVESADQVKRLRVDGCSSVQGYFYSRPVPVSELPGIFEKFDGAPARPSSLENTQHEHRSI